MIDMIPNWLLIVSVCIIGTPDHPKQCTEVYHRHMDIAEYSADDCQAEADKWHRDIDRIIIRAGCWYNERPRNSRLEGVPQQR